MGELKLKLELEPKGQGQGRNDLKGKGEGKVTQHSGVQTYDERPRDPDVRWCAVHKPG